MSAADKDAEIAALRQQNATLQARVKELETGTARLSVRLSEMGAAMLARPEPEVAPAAAPAVDNSAIELIQGMMMAQSQALAKFEKKMDDRTSNLESMSMQAAMNGAKQTSQTGEAISRLEGMAMTAATTTAKFEKNIVTKLEEMMGEMMQAALTASETKEAITSGAGAAAAAAAPAAAAPPPAAHDMSEVGEALQRIEGMNMTQATTLSKFSKKMDERTMGLESMMMQAAMNQSKTASTNAETQERLEGMGMQAATEMAKFKRGVNEKFEELMTAMMEEMAGGGMFAQAPAPAPAPAEGGAAPVTASPEVSDAVQRLEGMAMQAAAGHAKFEKKVLERTETIESMAMAAAMNGSKQHSQVKDVLERLEGMSMSHATSVAKFESKMTEKHDSQESMLMAASMGDAKFQKMMNDRTSGMEAMLMAGSVANGKLTSMVGKLVGPQTEVELEPSDLPTESQYGAGISSETVTSTAADE